MSGYLKLSVVISVYYYYYLAIGMSNLDMNEPTYVKLVLPPFCTLTCSSAVFDG